MREFFARALTISTSCFWPTPRRATGRRGIDRELEFRQQAGGLPVDPGQSISPNGVRGSEPRKMFSATVMSWHQGELLIDYRDAGALRIGERLEPARARLAP